MTRKQSVESDDTFIVGHRNTTEEGLVEISGVRAVTIAAGNNSAVDARAVAVPDLNVRAFNGLASSVIIYLSLKMHFKTLVS